MKKLLAILASVTLVSSSSAVVVSCGTSFNADNDKYANNDLNDIIDASLAKAKSVIINNEYGIDQTVVRNNQNLLDKKDARLLNKYYGPTDDSNASIKSGTNIDLSGTNGIDDGITYIMKGIFSKIGLNPVISNALLSAKNLVVDTIYNVSPSIMTMENLNDYNHSIWNNGISGLDYPINTALQAGRTYLNMHATEDPYKTIISIIDTVLKDKNQVANETIANFFSTNNIIKMIRAVLDTALASSSDKGPSIIQDVVYKNEAFVLPDFSATADTQNSYLESGFNDKTVSYQIDKDASLVSDIKVSQIKNEFFASIDRIINFVLDWDKMGYANDASLTSDTDSDYLNKTNQDLSNKVAWLISYIAKKGKVETKHRDDQLAIEGYIVEGLRLITILNAQFNLLENTNDYNPTDSEHLFSSSQTNYEYLNSKENNLFSQKLGESDYMKNGDEPINLNYLFYSLNYYLGGINDRSQEGYYRIQKFLFLLMNDPINPDTMPDDVPAGSEGWKERKSEVIDFICSVGYKFIKNYFKGDTSDLGKAMNKIKSADIDTLKDIALKPILLGALNGNSMKTVISLVVNAIKMLISNGVIPQSTLDGLKVVGIDIDDILTALERLANDSEFNNDTFHSLFTHDFGKIIRPLSFIPEKYMNELFGPDLPVNLGTIMNMSLAKILSIFNVDGFKGGKISPIGDWYTTQSIPQLVNTLNNGLNSNSDVPLTKYIVHDNDNKIDYTKSLKSRDINFKAIYDFVYSIIGKSSDQVPLAKQRNNDVLKWKGKEFKYDDQINFVTKLLDDLVVTGPLDDGTVPEVQFKPLIFAKDLGFYGQVPKTVKGGKDQHSVFATGNNSVLASTALYDASTKTITCDTIGLDDNPDVRDKIKLDSVDPEKVKIVSASIAGNKLNVTLNNTFEQTEKKQTIKLVYTDGDKTGTSTFEVPPLNNGLGMDLQIRSESITGSFFRLMLPEIDKLAETGSADDGKAIFTVNDKFFEMDLLKSYWTSFVDFIKHMNNVSEQYSSFIKKIIKDEDAFEITYDENDITYFQSNRKLIKGLTFVVTYKNYVVGETNKYLFTVSRDSNINTFKIESLMTNKVVEN